MATVEFVPVQGNADGFIYRAAALATGDNTGVLTINEGSWDMVVHVYGTVGGSTTTITGGINSAVGDMGTVDDAFGEGLVFTSLPMIKPIGPAIRQLRAAITGGAGTGITVDVFVTKKRV